MKPYQRIPIDSSDEPLVAIPSPEFDLVTPHPYASLGAPYGETSPFFVRSGVLDRLRQAQQKLQVIQPGWRIQIFDAYRPVSVQQFMVNFTFEQVVRDRAWDPNGLTSEQHQEALSQVYQFWAVPNLNPATPPPHSTGAAVDITVMDAAGNPVDMGSAIDEISVRSYPDHFVGSAEFESFDQNRQLLNFVMRSAGFARHYHEWWHFSWGDQLWAWSEMRSDGSKKLVAKYGRVET
jgi:zinc D-Ala-D-Ala dipeptidase